jgi:NitT/TauT family transport system substrate-binding protein
MKTAITKVTVVAATLVVLAGCSAPAPATDGEAEVVDITLAFVPVAGSAPIYVADQEGFFEEEGLSVTLQEVGGPAAMAALQNGEAQIASLGASVAVTAISQGLPIEVIRGSNATSEPGTDGDPNVVVVMPDSGFEEAADLNGAVVATQTLSSQATIMARSSMDNLGGDSFSVQFLDVPFPDQLGALRSGSVDAAVLTEPFLTAALDEGAVPLFDFGNNAYSEGGPVGLFISQQEYAAANPEVLEAFNRAMDAALAWTLEDEDRLRAALPGYVGLSVDQAERMLLPVFSAEVSEQGMAELVVAMVRYGIITKAPNMDALLP